MTAQTFAEMDMDDMVRSRECSRGWLDGSRLVSLSVLQAFEIAKK
jgi:hypothetical protein